MDKTIVIEGDPSLVIPMDGQTSLSIPVDGDSNVNIVANTTDYNRLINKPSINDITLVGNISLEGLGTVRYSHASTEEWNSRLGYIPMAGEICVYDDYKTFVDTDGVTKTAKGIKIGDGLAYLIDLPYVADDVRASLYDHIIDANIHTNMNEKTSWNSKLECNGVIGETLVFG